MSIDLYGIGNALVDSEYKVSEAILSQTGFVKGTMTLVDAAERQQLITLLEDTSKITLSKRAGGGSAANTVVTTALLGGSTFYSCKVSNDKTGDFFAQDLIDLSVATNLAEARPAGVTAQVLTIAPQSVRWDRWCFSRSICRPAGSSRRCVGTRRWSIAVRTRRPRAMSWARWCWEF